tara:strand:- start:47 stop:2458 length:2412 start_codon:yes stop_codon:yes gene_type:complete
MSIQDDLEFFKTMSKETSRQPDFSQFQKTEIPEVLSADVQAEVQKMEEIRQKSNKMSLQSASDLKVEEEGWTDEDSLAAADKFHSSLLLGWGDELDLWTDAIIQGVSTDTSPSEIYAQLRKDYDARQEAFEQRQPEAYLAADIGGAIASPINYIPVVGQATAAARLAAKAPKLAKAAQLAAPVVRGGVESAIYGAGEAEEGQRLEQGMDAGVTGAAFTGAFRAGFKTLGLTGDVISKRRIKQNLVDDQGNFTPITLASTGKDQSTSEQMIHSFYKTLVAPSFGAQGAFLAQEKRIFANKEKLLEAQKEMFNTAKKQAEIKFDLSKNKLKQGMSTQQEKWKRTEAAYKEASKRKTDPLETAFKSLQEGKTNNKFFKQGIKETQEVSDGLRFLFRDKMFNNSLPKGATEDDIAKLATLNNSYAKMAFVDDLWKNEGYSMIKDIKMRIKAGEFEESLTKAINNDPVFLVNIANLPAFQKDVKSVIQNLVNFKDKNARIDGDIMANIRSRLGTTASAAGDPQVQRAYRTVQSKVDDIIKKNLTSKKLKDFEEERSKWKNQIILRDAVGDASTMTKHGDFDEEDWFKSINKNSQWDKRWGQGPFKKDALDLKTLIEKKQKDHAKAASKAARGDSQRIKGLLEQEKSRLTAKLGKEKQRVLGESIRRREAQLGSKKQVMDSFSKNSVEGMRLQAIEADLKALKELSSSHNPSWFHSLAANSILAKGVGQLGQLGQKFGFAIGASTVGGLPGVAAAIGTGKLLSTQPAQKFVAGQTPLQEGIQRMLKNDATGYTADVLSRSLAKGMLTGE